MKLPLYQIDAFTRRVFGGNPAAVLPLPHWLPDALLQHVAAENNLAETAFFVPLEGQPGRYQLRWFTPTQEVNFCGHATLATAHALWECLGVIAPKLTFQTRMGDLTAVRGEDGAVVLDFPRLDPVPASQTPAELSELLGTPVHEVFTVAAGNVSVFAVLDSEAAVRELVPDWARLSPLDDLTITARGEQADFVSRCFAPGMGIPEDPVTGSAHATLAPYWSGKLGKTLLHALQVSARGGELHCEVLPDRVKVSGHAALYLQGSIHLTNTDS
ncbi:PhzF family phenazine biosynthesis protein [Deinococcus sp. KNUC1210]|uniref:PhzF family phenazine biosynthesis protein n=1 Tax=Deinococcus sp. KNUC1210 TaxID=2917691 RepID=UPI001EF13BB3|nr:PhzF family phenazine biosynthesis protein [Deinococcus sp. KNUC1210]ULH16772.1 PhzF family phenazine biosynthesis protein [Deinococcus sp. KNUC1210]